MFSPNEEAILKILRRTKKPIRIIDIAIKMYGEDTKLKAPREIVSGAIIRINRKVRRHKLDWFIAGSGGVGRGGKSVWLQNYFL